MKMYINDNVNKISHVFKAVYSGRKYDPACGGELINYKVVDVTETPKYKVCERCKANGTLPLGG